MEPSENPDAINTVRTITRGGARIYAVNGVGALVGLVTTAMIAFHFGVGAEIEAFFAATTTYFLAAKLLQSGAAGGVIIPALVRVRSNLGDEEWNRFLSSAVLVAAFASTLLAIAIAVALPWATHLLVPGFSDEKRDLVVMLARILTIGIATAPVISLLSAALNSEGRFGVPEISNFAGTIVYLGFVAAGPFIGGIEFVAIGMATSGWIVAIVLFVAVSNSGFRFKLVKPWRNTETRYWLKALRPFSWYTVVMQLRAVFLIALLSTLPAGSMAYYRFGVDFVAKVGSLVQAPINSMLIPYLSETLLRTDLDRFRKSVATATVNALLLISLPAILLALNAQQIARIVWGRGEFEPAAVIAVGNVVAIGALALFPQVMYGVLNKSMMARGRTGVLNIVAGLGQMYHFGLIIWLVPRWGYIGAAWHGVFATTLLVITMAIALHFVQSWPDWKSVTSHASKSALLIVAAGAGVFAITGVISGDTGSGAILRILISLVVAIGVFIGGAYAMRLAIIIETVSLVTASIRRPKKTV